MNVIEILRSWYGGFIVGVLLSFIIEVTFSKIAFKLAKYYLDQKEEELKGLLD